MEDNGYCINITAHDLTFDERVAVIDLARVIFGEAMSYDHDLRRGSVGILNVGGLVLEDIDPKGWVEWIRDDIGTMIGRRPHLVFLVSHARSATFEYGAPDIGGEG